METPAHNFLAIPCPSCWSKNKTRDDYGFIKEDGEIILDPEKL